MAAVNPFDECRQFLSARGRLTLLTLDDFMKVPMKIINLAVIVAGLIGSPVAQADGLSLTVHAGQPGAKINPAMWGIFFEDINFGGDGGLYA